MPARWTVLLAPARRRPNLDTPTARAGCLYNMTGQVEEPPAPAATEQTADQPVQLEECKNEFDELEDMLNHEDAKKWVGFKMKIHHIFEVNPKTNSFRCSFTLHMYWYVEELKKYSKPGEAVPLPLDNSGTFKGVAVHIPNYFFENAITFQEESKPVIELSKKCIGAVHYEVRVRGEFHEQQELHYFPFECVPAHVLRRSPWWAVAARARCSLTRLSARVSACSVQTQLIHIRLNSHHDVDVLERKAAIMYASKNAELGVGAFMPEWFLYSPKSFAFDEGKAPILQSKTEKKKKKKKADVEARALAVGATPAPAPAMAKPAKERARPTYKVHLVMRRHSAYYRQVITLTFLMTSLSFCVYAVEISDFENRMPLVLTLLLTVVAFKLSIADVLPNLPYSTLLDYYIHSSMLCLIAVSAATTISKGMHTYQIDNEASSGNSSLGEKQPHDRVFAGQASTLDLILTVDMIIGYCLAAVWFLFNVDFVWRTCIYWCELRHQLKEEGCEPLTKPDVNKRVGNVENSVISAQKVKWGTYGWKHGNLSTFLLEHYGLVKPKAETKPETKSETYPSSESAAVDDVSATAEI